MRIHRPRLTSRDVVQGMASNKQIAERLEIAREALRMDQAQFADLAGVSRQAYNNWIKQRSQPRIDQAILLCEAHGITLDWIYRGRPARPTLRRARRGIKSLAKVPHLESRISALRIAKR